MDGMTELEYWQKTAQLWEDKNKRLEEYLKDCRESNDYWRENSETNTQNMITVQTELFTLKSRIQEANNIMLGRMKAATITLAGINQKTPEESFADGYTTGLSEGTSRAIVADTQLYQKAIDTNEPLP